MNMAAHGFGSRAPGARRVLCSLVLLVLLATAATGLRAEVQVFFSPRGGAEEALISLARSARMYLDAACYTFSLESVADELVAAQKRGVRVRVASWSSVHPSGTIARGWGRIFAMKRAINSASTRSVLVSLSSR